MAVNPVYVSYDGCPCTMYCNILCDKCRICSLRTALIAANDTIRFLSRDHHEALSLTHSQKMDVYYKIRRSDIPINIDTILADYSLSYLKFITITFDPEKFGSNNDSDHEKDYILSVLIRLSRSYFFFYGCFEFHKSGTVHAHLLMASSENDSFWNKTLKSYFTDKPRNRNAVTCYPAKMPQSVRYINKESDDYFFYDKSNLNNGLDDGL